MKKCILVFLRILLGLIVGIIICAGLVYFTGVLYFQSHFPFQTTFLGYDVSQRTPSVIDACMKKESAARTLTLLEMDDEKETIDLYSAIGYTRTVQEPAGGWIAENDSWYWPLSLYNSRDLSRDAEIHYDEKMLEETIDGLNIMDPDRVTPPRDAVLEWQDGILVIVPEDNGNMLYRDRLTAVMKNAIENDIPEVDLVAEDCYQKAAILSDDEELNRILSRYVAIGFQRLTIDLTGEKIELTPDDILAFYNINEKTNRLTLNKDAVESFVISLKETYDTYELQRPFVNHSGKTVMVGTRADTYGFRMDLDATIQLITETLKSHESTEIVPVWTFAALARDKKGCDIGDTYIEVSISEQRLWAYRDGEVVMTTDVVTGNSGNHDTPRGVFRILYKSRGVYLEGADYRNYVDFWMPLTWDGVGLHDATWRGSFGGSIYTYSGSHGCINLPWWAASELYGSFEAGTPVVVW